MQKDNEMYGHTSKPESSSHETIFHKQSNNEIKSRTTRFSCRKIVAAYFCRVKTDFVHESSSEKLLNMPHLVERHIPHALQIEFAKFREVQWGPRKILIWKFAQRLHEDALPRSRGVKTQSRLNSVAFYCGGIGCERCILPWFIWITLSRSVTNSFKEAMQTFTIPLLSEYTFQNNFTRSF